MSTHRASKNVLKEMGSFGNASRGGGGAEIAGWFKRVWVALRSNSVRTRRSGQDSRFLCVGCVLLFLTAGLTNPHPRRTQKPSRRLEIGNQHALTSSGSTSTLPHTLSSQYRCSLPQPASPLGEYRQRPHPLQTPQPHKNIILSSFISVFQMAALTNTDLLTAAQTHHRSSLEKRESRMSLGKICAPLFCFFFRPVVSHDFENLPSIWVIRGQRGRVGGGSRAKKAAAA